MSAVRELPFSIRTRLERRNVEQARSEQVLEELTNTLVARRKRYVEGRAASGIEEVWRKCDDNMACVDELTGQGSAIVKPRYTKGQTLTDGIRRNDDTASSLHTRSRAFERLTARYVAAGAAKINSIITAVDAKLFSINPTPVPDLIDLQEAVSPVSINGNMALRDPKPEEMMPPNPTDPLRPPPLPPGMVPSQMAGVPLTTKDLADEQASIAHRKAKKAEQFIYDWQIEAKYQKQIRRMNNHAARYGTGVMKGPFPELRKMRSVTMTDKGMNAGRAMATVEYKEVLKPGFLAISPWDCFPDPDCGEDIHAGEGVFERDHVTEKTLRQLAEEDGYFKQEILLAIKEGPMSGRSQNEGPSSSSSSGKDGRYELWYYTGTLTLEEAKAINEALGSVDKNFLLPMQSRVPVIMTMVNDRVIKCVQSQLASGKLPYNFLPWEFREGSCWGVGVAEQCFMPQEMLNGALRAMANNASAGTQVILNKQLVVPADQSPVIYMQKLWHLSADATTDDIRKAFGIFEIPNVTDKMLAIINHAYLVAENSTNIPLITQGHSGKTSPETYGAAQLQDNNANQLLRDVAGRYDDFIGERNVDDLYEWLLLDPEVSADAKGDFQIMAKGASSLAERYIQDQFIAQEYPMVKDPAFGINPKKWYAQLRRSKHLNPEDVQYTDDEQQKIAQVPPPKAPQVQAAEIRAQVDLQRAKLDQDRDTIYVQAETDRTNAEHQVRMEELKAKIQLETLRYANERQMSLEQVKASLAETTMKLQTQKELAAEDRAGEALEPPNEPPGKAPTGQSYEK